MVPTVLTADTSDATRGRGTRAAEQAGPRPLVTRGLAPPVGSSPRPVWSPTRLGGLRHQSSLQLQGHTSVAIVVVAVTAIICKAQGQWQRLSSAVGPGAPAPPLRLRRQLCGPRTHGLPPVGTPLWSHRCRSRGPAAWHVVSAQDCSPVAGLTCGLARGPGLRVGSKPTQPVHEHTPFIRSRRGQLLLSGPPPRRCPSRRPRGASPLPPTICRALTQGSPSSSSGSSSSGSSSAW